MNEHVKLDFKESIKKEEIRARLIKEAKRIRDEVLPEAAELCRKQRRIPVESIQLFRKAGFFKILQPRAYGGYELAPNVLWEVVKIISEACMSHGWVLSIISNNAFRIALMDKKAQDMVWKDDPDAIASSLVFIPQQTTIKKVENGWNVTGRGQFSSGVEHCDWIVPVGFYKPVNGGDVEAYTFLMPLAEAKIVDTWYTHGLRGTGSQDVIFDNTFIPANQSQSIMASFSGDVPGLQVNSNPLYKIPMGQLLGRCISMPGYGATVGLLKKFKVQMQKRVSRLDINRAATSSYPEVRQVLARAELRLSELGRTLEEDMDHLLYILVSGEELDIETRVRIRLNSARIIEECLEIALQIYNHVGSNGLYEGNIYSVVINDLLIARTHYANNPINMLKNFGGMMFEEQNEEYFL